jgi:hypothetical protein
MVPICFGTNLLAVASSPTLRNTIARHGYGHPTHWEASLLGVSSPLWIQPPHGAAKRLPVGNVSPAWPYWVDANVGSNGEIGFVGSSANHPSELYYIPSLNNPPKRIRDFNAELASRYLGRSEEIE